MRASQRQSPSFRLWRINRTPIGARFTRCRWGGEAVKAQPVSYRYLLTYRGAPFELVAATNGVRRGLNPTLPARRDGPDACL